MNEAIVFEKGLERFREICQRITQYYMLDRYPFILQAALNQDDVRDSLQDVTALVEAVEAMLADARICRTDKPD
ncbi:MAG: hypothetical protein JW941_03575 [Candidatus Coatesbacteria bacterium]|nr:hypothetical protein [Candidatus Coatesbacteria bacterium]